MKHTTLFLLFGLMFLGLTNSVQAQSNYKKKSFRKYKSQWQEGHGEGSFRAHLGVGFPSLLKTSAAAFSALGGDVEHTGTPPVHISMEYGATEKFSVGGYLGYAKESLLIKDSYDEEYNFGWDQQIIIIGARGSYHFNGSKRTKFDPYASLMMGYNLVKMELVSGDDSFGAIPVSAGAISYSINLGMNYMFTPNVGVFAEVGYGVALANAGITIGM